MTQNARNIIANSLIGISVLCIVTFIAQHFMMSPRPSWHRDVAFLALAFASASEAVRRRGRRRMLQD